MPSLCSWRVYGQIHQFTVPAWDVHVVMATDAIMQVGCIMQSLNDPVTAAGFKIRSTKVNTRNTGLHSASLFKPSFNLSTIHLRCVHRFTIDSRLRDQRDFFCICVDVIGRRKTAVMIVRNCEACKRFLDWSEINAEGRNNRQQLLGIVRLSYNNHDVF